VAGDVLLATGTRHSIATMDDAALRGLGYLSIDPAATVPIGAALGRWMRSQAPDVADLSGPPPAVAVTGSLVAVREYGQRLAYALHGFQMRDEAQTRQDLWNWTVGLLVDHIPGVAGAVAGLVEPFAAHFLDADGTWDNGRDTGLRFGRAAAVAAAQVQLGESQSAAAAAFAAQAGTAFEGTSRQLGLPLPPTSPTWHWWEAALEGLPLPDFRDLLSKGYLEAHGVPAR
jgi:hypothetical protein